jgi:hypothetical protein
MLVESCSTRQGRWVHFAALQSGLGSYQLLMTGDRSHLTETLTLSSQVNYSECSSIMISSCSTCLMYSFEHNAFVKVRMCFISKNVLHLQQRRSPHLLATTLQTCSLVIVNTIIVILISSLRCPLLPFQHLHSSFFPIFHFFIRVAITVSVFVAFLPFKRVRWQL